MISDSEPLLNCPFKNSIVVHLVCRMSKQCWAQSCSNYIPSYFSELMMVSNHRGNDFS